MQDCNNTSGNYTKAKEIKEQNMMNTSQRIQAVYKLKNTGEPPLPNSQLFSLYDFLAHLRGYHRDDPGSPRSRQHF